MTIEARPKSIISLAPGITEAFFLLGLEAPLVGRSSFCLFPNAAKALPDMGLPLSPDIAAIIKAAPSILLHEVPLLPAAISKLEGAGITLIQIDSAKSFAALPDIINILYKLALGEEAGALAALPLYSSFTADLEEIRSSTALISEGASAAYLMGDYFLLTEEDYQSGVLSALSLQNISPADKSLEALAEANPDVLLVSSEMDIQALKEHPVLGTMPAVKEGRVYPVNQSLIDRRSLGSLSELLLLASAIYGDGFTLSKAELSFYKTPSTPWPQEAASENEEESSSV